MVVSGAGQGKAAKDAVVRAAVLGAARDWARDLVNTPPNYLFPQSFADNVKKRVAASPAKVTVSVLDEKALVKGGFGGIVGVGQGSVNPPRIVTMSYAPASPKASVALVGKGITFDSGGLNIKPSSRHGDDEVRHGRGRGRRGDGARRRRARPCRWPSPATSAWPRTCRAARPSGPATSW